MSKQTLLIVDDDPQQRQMLSLFFQVQDFVINESSNGLDAMKSLRDFRPDLVITDNSMPEMTGLELIHSIRSDPELADLKIIMVSGDLGDTANQALVVGADVFLAKPYDLTMLMSVVQALLKQEK